MENTYTISAFTENSPGVLHRITVLFTRRKVNVESLTVSETETKGISRFTIVIKTNRETARKIAKQIKRIVELKKVFVAMNQHLLFKEIAFMKVRCESGEKRLEIEDRAHRYGASVVFADDTSVIVEKTGQEDEINSLLKLVEPFGVIEFIRSGRIAVLKDPSAEDVSIFDD